MKKYVFAMIAAVLIASACSAQIGAKMIDNFEKNQSLKSPEWWKFDNITASVVKNPVSRPGDRTAGMAGKYSLNIKGSAKNWYCGGVGTYLGADASGYNGLEMFVYGYGPDSGTIKLELYDDDKGAWNTVYDKNWVPVKDDLWAYELKVDWRGWKRVYIPFTNFALTNPKRGDGVMNFDQNKGSGGLLQLQMIFLATSADGETNVNLDNIKLVTRETEE